MKLIGMVTLALGACVDFTASAQTIEDKLCIFEASRKLPAFPSMKIISSSAKSADATTVAVEIVAGLKTHGDALSLAQNIGLLGTDIETDIKRGFSHSYTPELANALRSRGREFKSVEIEIHAAGQQGTFAFNCAITSDSSVIASMKGLVK